MLTALLYVTEKRSIQLVHLAGEKQNRKDVTVHVFYSHLVQGELFTHALRYQL